VRVRRHPANGLERRVKRALDVALSCLALVILAVPMAVIAVAIKLTSPGPVFYRQERIGQQGRGFDFVKFRTMTTGDHEDVHRDYWLAVIAGDIDGCNQGDPEEHVNVLKMMKDDRVTAVGCFLRRYSLDELPQFWNVLRGDLSLVGPRPDLPYAVEVYSDWHREGLQALPGISGLWQVGGRSRVSFDEMVFQDLFYAANQTMLLDLALCLRTAPAIINWRGAV
jgi:lipopolysaccharide/colanic/teichoic acid biosynthesis glycosyltransferase